MSKRNETSRRRTYGRRQHEINERTERSVGVLEQTRKAELPEPGDRWGAASYARSTVAGWNNSWGID
jgi:protein-arginine kinase